MAELQPLDDRVVVQAVEREQTTRSGIVLPDTATEKPQEGKVIAVGPGAVNSQGKRVPMNVKAGDRVLFAKYAGTEVKVGSDEYLILKENDILAVVG